MKNLKTLLSKLKKKCNSSEKEMRIEIVTNDEASNIKGGNKEYKPLYLLETLSKNSRSHSNRSGSPDHKD